MVRVHTRAAKAARVGRLWREIDVDLGRVFQAFIAATDAYCFTAITTVTLV